MKISIWFQRAEAVCILFVVLYAYWLLHGNWILFIGLWLVFDFSMVGYAFGNKIGALVYNLGHSFLLPSVLGVLCLVTRNRLLIEVTLIWVGHITIDRMLGYGLKETRDFSRTHLGVIGPKRPSEILES